MPSDPLLLGWSDAAPPAPLGFAAPAAPAPAPRAPIHAEPEGHLITFAPTGAGKGRSAILPALLTYDGPALVIDPKGEACAVTARHRATLGPVVRLDPYGAAEADGLNPFDLAYYGLGKVEASLLLADLVAPKTFSKDPFWDYRARSLLAGLISYILHCKEPEDRHLGTVRALLSSADPVYAVAVAMDTAGKQMGAFAREELAQFLNLPERETRPSVLATATQHLTLFGDAPVAEAVRRTTFDLDAVRRGAPLTVYLVLPVEKLRSHGRLLRLWVATLLRTLMRRRRRPETPTLLLLDEAAQLGALDDLVTAMALMRGYGVRVWSFWQNLQQLRSRYPADWQTLLENARTLQVFGTHWLGRADLSALLGVVPDALALPPGRQLLIGPDGVPAPARMADYLADDLFRGRFDPNPLYGGPNASPGRAP